jgi:hypothetical protein
MRGSNALNAPRVNKWIFEILYYGIVDLPTAQIIQTKIIHGRLTHYREYWTHFYFHC